MKKFLRHSRRLFAGVLALAMLLSLTACKTETNNEDEEHTADKLARAAVAASGRDPDSLERLGDALDNAGIAAYVFNYYGVEEDGWTDCAVYRAGGAEAFEIAVLRLKDEAGAKSAAASMEQYIREREGAFTGYLPAQADIVSRSLAASQGPYAALLICERPEAARDAFFAILNGEEPPQPPTGDLSVSPTADEMALAILSAMQMDPDTLAYTNDDTALTALMEMAGLSPDTCEDFAMYWMPYDFEDEHALYLYVFKMENAADIKYSASAFVNDVRRANQQAYLDSNGGVPFISCEYRLIEGQYAAFVLTDSSEYVFMVYDAFYNLLGLEWSRKTEVFLFDPPALDGSDTPSTDSDTPSIDPTTGRIPYVDPGKEDMTVYDTSAILTAWEKKEHSALSSYDRAIYDAAVRVLGEILTDGMTDYEKEYAIYLWTVTHIAYDYSHQDTLAVTQRDAYTPYGGLVNRKGVCLGYASSFQLLMDMAGVECITVVGASMDSTEDHAWNQVRLDGEWYCVDPTWDGFPSYLTDLSPEKWDESWWGFFNVTSDELAVDHQWDYTSVPEATGTKYAPRH